MLKENTSDSYPGANLVATDPIAPAACCAYSTVAGLLPVVIAAGKPYIFRGGRLYFHATPAQLTSMCVGPDPAPTAFNDTDMIIDVEYWLVGTLFGTATGRFWLTDDPAWGEELVIVEQTVNDWAATRVDFTTVLDGLPTGPTKVYGYVETACGPVNAVGMECELSGAK